MFICFSHVHTSKQCDVKQETVQKTGKRTYKNKKISKNSTVLQREKHNKSYKQARNKGPFKHDTFNGSAHILCSMGQHMCVCVCVCVFACMSLTVCMCVSMCVCACMCVLGEKGGWVVGGGGGGGGEEREFDIHKYECVILYLYTSEKTALQELFSLV